MAETLNNFIETLMQIGFKLHIEYVLDKIFQICKIVLGLALQIYVYCEGSDQPEHPDQGLHCRLTQLLYTTECNNWEENPGLYFVHAQDDLYLCILAI